MLLVSMKSKAVFQNGHSLFLSSLSCLSLSVVSHTHICFLATENSSVFNLCCTELVQHNHIHSIH